MVDTKVPSDWIAIMKNARAMIEPDLTITCGDTTYRVHKIIMTSASAFFDKACNGPCEEGRNNVINLPDDDPTVFQAILAYLNEGTYDDVLQNILVGHWPEHGWVRKSAGRDEYFEEGNYDDMLEIEAEDAWHMFIPFHVAVYTLADKYNVRGLMEKAEHSLEALVHQSGHGLDSDSMSVILELVVEVTREGSELEGAVKAFAYHLAEEGAGHVDEPEVMAQITWWPALCSAVISHQRSSGVALWKK